MSENEILHYLHWLLWDSQSPWSDAKHAFLLYFGYVDHQYRNYILSCIYDRQPLQNDFKKNLKRCLPDILAGKLKPKYYEKHTKAENIEILFPEKPVPLPCPKWDRSKELAPGFDFLKRRA